MATELLYLRDPDLLCADARITAVRRDAEGRLAIGTDRTPFYPQGGGQPGDRGLLAGEFGAATVEDTRQEGEAVWHLLPAGSPTAAVAPAPGDPVRLAVDAATRRQHAALHGAGELVCAVMRHRPAVGPVVRAMHFPACCRIEFAPAPGLAFDPGLALEPGLAASLERELAALVTADHPILVLPAVARDRAERLTGQDLAHLPAGTPIRLVSPCPGFVRACKGTHLARAGAIGTVRIRRLRFTKGRLGLDYEVTPPAPADASSRHRQPEQEP